ncbi:MAG TPA: 3-isopropylmalate dehydratase small subunit [Nitrososphaeraceae archaeon]|jgi:3-isopropylmalate/(R)-2-methylmalate dehydratase small subunit|nr:3-isopropylmalate dehydratase small subunit [Nitrososphaeraceae archaeon]
MDKLKGKIHKYERDNIDTDVIIPGPYLKIHDHKELGKHAMEGIDPNFSDKINQGDFLLTGKNFGCGSSREHAPIALHEVGIRAILSPSFARIFYRNAVDGGYLLPIEIESDLLKKISDNDQLEIDIDNNSIFNLTTNEKYKIKPFPEIISKIVNAGGLLYFTE